MDEIIKHFEKISKTKRELLNNLLIQHANITNEYAKNESNWSSLMCTMMSNYINQLDNAIELVKLQM